MRLAPHVGRGVHYARRVGRSLPYFSEFSPAGKLLFNAEFPTAVNTYRAYRLPWHPEAR
jgi:hypothetical protein